MIQIMLILLVSLNFAKAENCPTLVNNFDMQKKLSASSSEIVFKSLPKVKIKIKDDIKSYAICPIKLGEFSFEIGLDSSCSSKISVVLNALDDMFKNDMKCMINLSTVAKKRAEKLFKIFSKKYQTQMLDSILTSKEKILISERSYKPLTIKCYASQEALGGFGMASGMVAPDFPHLDLLIQNDGTINTATLFHEMIHFLGYTHNGDTPEMAYACGLTCSMKNLIDQDPSIKAAKNICEKNFKSDEEEYLKNFFIMAFGNALDGTVELPASCSKNIDTCKKKYFPKDSQ